MRAAARCAAYGGAPCAPRSAARNLRAVILLTRALAGLPGAERSALELLVDLSRVVPVDDPDAPVVRLEVGDGPAADIPTLIARGWDLAPHDGVLRISHRALAVIAGIAGLEREKKSAVRDRFGRVPSWENALVGAGLEHRPVVSQAATVFRRAVAIAAGTRPVRFVVPWPLGRRWAVAFTHDLDVVALWPAFTALRIAELAGKRDLRRAARTAAAAIGSAFRAPVREGVQAILDAERGLASTWFILCGTPTAGTFRRGDLTYRPESAAARAILEAVAGAGHELALHGSFETLDRDAAFAEQRERLAKLTGRQVAGVRQHFLRIRHGDTENAMRDAGFRYDSTCGFADRNGFRAGVADVLPLPDPGSGRSGAFAEVPFCFMDRALSKYRDDEEPGTWRDEALRLAAAAREVEGLWCGIWHPNVTLAALGYPGAAAAFAATVDAMIAERPYVATLDTIVRWRTARRGVRVRSVAAGGAVEAYHASPGAWDEPIALEDAARRPCELAK